MSSKAPIPVLPWSANLAEEKRFRLIVSISIILALIFSVIIPLIELPKQERQEVEKLPPRLAKMLLEKKTPEPPKIKKPKPKVEPPKTKKEEPKPKAEEKKPEPKKAEAKPKPKPKVDIEAARKKAASAGVLAMQDMLAELREAQPVVSKDTKKLQTSGSKERVKAPSILTAKAAKSSGGVDTSKFVRSGGNAKLEGRDVTEVASDIENLVAVETEEEIETAGRSLAEIQRVIESNRPAIFSIYQRALRKNSTLRGKVTFKITIEPSGMVTECSIIDSELNDPKLERKLVLRIKRLNFGAKDVEITTVDYPIDFLPTL